MMKRVFGIGIAVSAILLAGSGTAFAQLAPGSTAYGSISSLNVSIGDTFGTQYPASSNPLYDFVDVYTFTFTGPSGSASGSAISFASMVANSVTNLQAAVFAPGSFSAGTYASSQGDTSGALNPWTTLNLGTGSATTFSAPLVNGQAYSIEIRGLIGTSGASYGGNLSITSVPEASTFYMLLAGLGSLLFIAVGRPRRRG